jgi:superfamily I DNA and/or RNA helicase
LTVDRILLGLQEKEFTEFTRVGSLRKIAKPLLRHVLHYSDRSVSSKDHDRLALNELEEMLKSIDTPVSERVHIEAAIVDLKSQITAKRAERLKNMRIVGVTTAAATFDILNDNRFAIVLLDEASQMVEPASLVPLIRFGCERALLIGDPKQLPPTLRRHGSHLHTTDVGTLADTHLSKTMFVRLAASVQPIMLRTQYRLHPHLADLPSKLFYDNVLRNGVTADDRAALIERIPPLSFIEVDAGKETMTAGGSYTNYQEAVMIKQICRSLVRLVDPADIGAISLYKAQAFKIDAELKEIAPGIVCSTVDAFQGAERVCMLVQSKFVFVWLIYYC